jgi:hypothetical protein
VDPADLEHLRYYLHYPEHLGYHEDPEHLGYLRYQNPVHPEVLAYLGYQIRIHLHHLEYPVDPVILEHPEIQNLEDLVGLPDLEYRRLHQFVLEHPEHLEYPVDHLILHL